MTILDIPQRSPEWFAARRGMPTCSSFGQILTPAKGDPSKAQEKLINELIAEALCPTYGPTYQSADMEAGEQLEPQARAFYEFAKDCTVREVGFAISDCGRFGGSPDGLVSESGGLEIKCPAASTHIAYVRAGVLPDDYKCQVHGYLVLTGRKWWDFLSYCPGIDPFLLRVERDAFTEKLAAEVPRFCERHEAARALFKLPPLRTLTPGWVPTYDDPDNRNLLPSAEPA